ncbi:MAG: MarR family winged helix-turn-helix transcriptional regulator, partial [Tabrizicola sp.]
MPDQTPTPEATLFAFFNEVGILAQLSRALFEARLPDGFNLPQFVVLNHLVRVKDGQTPLALARAFQVPKTSMTHSLAVLERHGLIEMRPNARDGRSKCVFLTEAGRAFR